MRAATTSGFANVVISPVFSLCSAIAFRTRRMILPDRVFGNASLNIMTSGYTAGPATFLVLACISFFNSSDGVCPTFNVTNAKIVDPFTEWQIQQALNMILSNTTSILIAHRLSTVKAAHRIIVLEEGKIIEEGNHEFLLQRGGRYADLYNTYFRHQSLAYVEQSRSLAQDHSE